MGTGGPCCHVWVTAWQGGRGEHLPGMDTGSALPGRRLSRGCATWLPVQVLRGALKQQPGQAGESMSGGGEVSAEGWSWVGGRAQVPKQLWLGAVLGKAQRWRLGANGALISATAPKTCRRIAKTSGHWIRLCWDTRSILAL